MNPDTELESWRKQWQEDRPEPPNLADAVHRGTRFLRAMLVAEILITIVMGGGITVWALRSSNSDVAALAGATWVFLAAAWTFGIWNRKGCWAPAGYEHAAFVTLAVRRCQRALTALTFGCLLYIVELLFCLSWIYRRLALRSSLTPMDFLTSRAIVVTLILSVTLGAVALWFRRNKRQELANLLAMHPDSTLVRDANRAADVYSMLRRKRLRRRTTG